MELKERVIRIVSAYFEKLSKKAVFLKQQNSYDLTMEQICNTDSCKDAVKVYCCDYAIYEMKDAYEPFLSWIRQAYYAEFADSYTVEEFVENCGVYSLQREVFCSYILSGVCERKLEVLMNEYDYEEEQTRESIYSSLRYIAGDKKLVLGIGKLHMAPLCVLRFLNMILDREDAIHFVFTYGETFLVKEYCQDEWQKLMQKAEENKLILALENSDIIQNFDVPDTFTYKEAEISSYINRLNNNDKYLSCIERATSIPSLEVVMKLALALDTTPDTFLTGSIRYESDEWRDIAELMRGMNAKQLDLAKNFLTWLSTQSI